MAPSSDQNLQSIITGWLSAFAGGISSNTPKWVYASLGVVLGLGVTIYGWEYFLPAYSPSAVARTLFVGHPVDLSKIEARLTALETAIKARSERLPDPQALGARMTTLEEQLRAMGQIIEVHTERLDLLSKPLVRKVKTEAIAVKPKGPPAIPPSNPPDEGPIARIAP